MKLKKFEARDIKIFSVYNEETVNGLILSNKCKVIINKFVPIFYNNLQHPDSTIGTASLMKIGKDIYADLNIVSAIEDSDEAKMLVQQMYPYANFNIKDRDFNVLKEIEIHSLSLSFNKPFDGAEVLGKMVRHVTRYNF